MPRKKTLAIDFDGVLHNYKEGDWEGLTVIDGGTVPGAVAAMQVLHHRYVLIVHTCRAAHIDGVNAVQRWLKFHHIPFDAVTNVKPHAEAYIDDRGFKFDTWQEVVDVFTRRT